MGQTPVYLLPWPEGADPADGPLDIGDLARRTEEVLAQELGSLDNRLDILESIGPPPASPTTQNGESILNGTISLPAGIWTTIRSGPILAVGTWLILSQTQIQATDNSNPGHTTVQARTALWTTSGGGYPDQRSGAIQVICNGIVVITQPSAINLQAYNNTGRSQVLPNAPNPTGYNATRLAWIKLA